MLESVLVDSATAKDGEINITDKIKHTNNSRRR